MPEICPEVRQIRAGQVKESDSLLPIRVKLAHKGKTYPLGWKNTDWRKNGHRIDSVFRLSGYGRAVDAVPAVNKKILKRREYVEGYEVMCDFQKLYAAHKAARRGKRGKAEVIDFELNLAQNLCELGKKFEDRTYEHGGYNHFTVYEPKERSIFAPGYSDRVVQHCLCDNILMPAFEPRLIYDNAACRKNKGTHFALDRLTDFMRDFYGKYGTEGYFLKCDIRKYFENIDHEILKRRLGRVFKDSEVFDLLCHVIDSFENKPGAGLPLGNQTSQWFALYYLDGVDRLIKERLRIRYYSRYMDDFVLLHHDRNYLRECLRTIREFCRNELKLELNEKTQIFPIKNGVDYLGWHFYMTDNGKIIRKLRNSNKKKMKKRMKKLARDYHDRKLDFEAVKRSLMSTHGHLIHGNTYRLRKKLMWETVFTHGEQNSPETKNIIEER